MKKLLIAYLICSIGSLCLAERAGFPTTVNAKGAKGQYVKVQFATGTDGLCLAEVRVFSTAASQP